MNRQRVSACCFVWARACCLHVGIGGGGEKATLNANRISHPAKKKIGHLANRKIPQMADASRGFLLYNEKLEIRSAVISNSEKRWVSMVL
jgi:hypothetical protein